MEDGELLLHQLLTILERDNIIDEIGFVHPTQLAELHVKPVDNLQCLSEQMTQHDQDTVDANIHSVHCNERAFWHKNHKLAISTCVLMPLYSAAVQAYRVSDKKYKALILSLSSINSSKSSQIPAHNLVKEDSLGNDVLRNSKVLLILNCDFGSAWNSRKLVISRSHNHLFLMNELKLSQLILSYSPKSDYAWTHRRWAIRMLPESCLNSKGIIEGESELVKNIAEKTKMNYRAWNHRGFLVSYMSRLQVLEELTQSKSWAKLHVADSSCFHYRRRLMLRLLLEEDFVRQDLYTLWKEELHWIGSLIEQYAGREALWMHRRFLFQWGLAQFASSKQILYSGETHPPMNLHLTTLIDQELQSLQPCFVISDDQFEDGCLQAKNAATYLLWMWKQTSHLEDSSLQEKLMRLGDIHMILNRFCPEKAFLSEVLEGQSHREGMPGLTVGGLILLYP